MDSMLEEMFCRLGDRIVIAHAKDVKAAAGDGTDLPAAGLGVLDYPLYLRLLTHLDREIEPDGRAPGNVRRREGAGLRARRDG